MFRFAGIQVFLHWSWFLVAIYEMNARSGTYSSIVWNGIEYISLFGIVTLHEFGHALACRQVGGRAERIVLWPLGGVAYVDPPPRPGATLWSIAAGPLVNVALLPVFGILLLVAYYAGVPQSSPNLNALLQALMFINAGLLLFNMLPVYPLDGGQILRSLLWFFMGRAKSLMAAAVIGFVGVAGLGLLAFAAGSLWIGILAGFAALQCVNGFTYARQLQRMADAPRREGFTCPSCKMAAPKGAFWGCGLCRRAFDPFESADVALTCPGCKAQSSVLRCTDCGEINAYEKWLAALR